MLFRSHALRVFRHYLLCSGAPRPEGVRSDFTIRTDNQAVSWLRSKRDVNRFMARWLDELEEFRFDVEHVPGRLNPADLLSRRGFPAATGPPSPSPPPLDPPLFAPRRRRSSTPPPRAPPGRSRRTRAA